MERLGERLGELLLLCQACSEEPSSPRVSGRQLLLAGYMAEPSRKVISDIAEDTRLPVGHQNRDVNTCGSVYDVWGVIVIL